MGLFWQVASASTAHAQHVVPYVVVAQPVLQPLVAALLKGVTTPETILTSLRDSHNALLAPSDIQKLRRADIIVTVDHEMTGVLVPWVKDKKNPRAMVLVLSQYEEAKALHYRRTNPFLPEEKLAKKVDAKTDPHLWLDPLRMAAVLTPLAKDIASYNPEFEATLTHNAQTLALHLRAVTFVQTKAVLDKARAEAARFTPDYPIIPVLVQHDAFQYFYERYGFHDGGYITSRHGQSVGATSIGKLYKAATTHRVRCVFAAGPDRTVQKIADLSHARMVIVNPEREVTSRDVAAQGWFANDYDRFIANVTRQFAQCLR